MAFSGGVLLADSFILREDLIYAKPALESHPDCRDWDPKRVRPLGNIPTLAVKFNHHIGAAVILLFLTRCPTAIIRTVTFCIVATLQSVFRGWTRPHVGKKVGKHQPAITNGDPATAVVTVKPAVGVQASLLHGVPHRIFRQIGMPVHVLARNSVKGALSRQLITQTTARADLAGSEVVGVDDALPATYTDAGTHQITPIFKLSLHSQAPKGSTNQIFHLIPPSWCGNNNTTVGV